MDSRLRENDAKMGDCARKRRCDDDAYGRRRDDDAPDGDATMDESVPRLLQLLSDEGEVSMQRATKRLGVSTSELRRMLASLGDDARYDGLDLVVARRDGERIVLSLTDKGRALCART